MARGTQTGVPYQERSRVPGYLREIGLNLRADIRIPSWPRLFCQRLQTAVSQQVMEEGLRSACRLFFSSVGCGTAQHNPDARANKAQQSLYHVWTQNWMFWHCGCLRPQMGVTTRAKVFQNTKTWDQFRTHGTVAFGKWQHERLWLKLIMHYAPPFVVDYRLYELHNLINEDILLSL